jgi:hypothetical protein
MASFAAVCTLAIFIVLFSYLPSFAKRLNSHTTSVGGEAGESCAAIERKNVVCITLHLVILERDPH